VLGRYCEGPPEVTGGIASGLDAMCGMMAFRLTIASRIFGKRITAQA
jgi:hypothetical protein